MQVAKYVCCRGLGQVDARVVTRGEWALRQCLDGGHRFFAKACGSLPSREAQAVIQIVGEKFPEHFVDCDRPWPFMPSHAVATFDGKLVLAGKAGGKRHGSRAFVSSLGVVAKNG